MNENDVLFQKVTQAYSESKIRVLLSGALGFLLIGALGFFFPSMPVSLSGIIHHSHSFTRLKIYHHIYLIYHTFRHSNPSSMQDVCPMNLV